MSDSSCPYPARVHLNYIKWDGRPLREFSARRLGRDAYGIWLATDSSTVVTWSDGTRGKFPNKALTLVPQNGQWWSITWRDESGNGDLSRMSLYGNISLPPVRQADRLTLTDLDLDIVEDGACGYSIIDQDEFRQNADEMNYPLSVMEGALQAADNLMSALSNDQEPFRETAAHWLRLWVDGI